MKHYFYIQAMENGHVYSVAVYAVNEATARAVFLLETPFASIISCER